VTVAKKTPKKKKISRAKLNTEVLHGIVRGAGEPRRRAGTKGGGPNRSTFFKAILKGTVPLGTRQSTITPGRRGKTVGLTGRQRKK
jgi:hypothetical protein